MLATNEEGINAVIFLRGFYATLSAKIFATNQKDFFRCFLLQKFSLAEASIEGALLDSLGLPSKKLLRLILCYLLCLLFGLVLCLNLVVSGRVGVGRLLQTLFVLLPLKK
jgi:hypothetical protein